MLQVCEDPYIIGFVMSQCNNTSSYDHHHLGHQDQAQAMEDIDVGGVHDYTTKSTNNNPWLPPQPMSTDASCFPWDNISADNQSRLYSSPLDLFSGSKTSTDVFFEGSTSAIDSIIGNNNNNIQRWILKYQIKIYLSDNQIKITFLLIFQDLTKYK